MDWAIWLALIVGSAAVLAAAAFVAVRALRAWRALKRLRRHLGRELERLADLGDKTVEKLEGAGNTSRLERSLARLRVTLARLAVLRQALDEATDAFGRFTAVYPRK